VRNQKEEEMASSFMAVSSLMMQEQGGGGAAAFIGLLMTLVWLAVGVFLIAAVWKVFVKAGQPGWAAIIPIYNIIVLLKIVDKPLWWFILFCIPLVNFVIAIIVFIALAEQFGKGVGYGLGLTFLGFIFFPMLGFGSATYKG